LPGVDFALPRSYAGSLSVNRTGKPNDALFFWGFESHNGSLAAPAGADTDAPWAIWLNGGYVGMCPQYEFSLSVWRRRPGSSSMTGLFNENGPIRVAPGHKLINNPYAWSQLADYFWVDQPVYVPLGLVSISGILILW
jgi:carboxypeptidase D